MTWSRCVVVLGMALLALFAASAEAAGVLVPRDGSPPIRVRSHRVTAVVEDGIARTTVRQTFVNPHGRALEAVYVFPVPEGAALVDLAMETGGQRLEGLLAERRTARRSYDRLVNRRIDPALVEQIGRSKFRLSVFPVLPDQPTVVEMTWIERVPLVRGELRYVYPLAEAGETTRTEEDLTVSVTMRSSATIASVSSTVPGMSTALASSHEARASFERNGAALDRDVVVVAKVASKEPSLAVRTFRGATGDPFFAAVVTPPEVAEDRVLARDVTLVLDTSGSMAGEKFDQAKTSARFLLDRLRPRDRVNVLLFSTDVRPFAPAPVTASAENVGRLRAFVDGALAQGATALGDALRAAAEAPAEPGRVSMVVLLTDGLPTVGVASPEEIVVFAKGGADRGLRVFAFGVGADVDGALLDAVALAGRGTSEVFRPLGEVESRLTAFLTRTESPVLSNLRLEIDGRAASDVLPRPLPDLFLGEQATIAGRAPLSGPHEFVVRAVLDGREVVLRSKVEVSSEPGGAAAVRDLYARSRLDFLERAHRLRLGLADDAYFAALDRGAYSTADELVRAMIDLSLETGVQCPYTAFLALLPEDKARLDPRDAAELDRAAERAKAKKREIAGLPPTPPKETAAPAPAKGEPAPTVEETKPTEESERVTEDPELKDSKTSDHNETDSDQETEESLGDPRFNADSPFEGPGTNGTIGIGGGAGGAFGGRRGGHRNLRAGGGGKKTQTAVDLGLEWLKNHQSPDGRWDADGFDALCKLNKCPHPGDSAYDPGVSGLAVLAFLGAGETHQSGSYKDTVKEGLKYLKNVQDTEGCFGPRTAEQFQSNHLWASLAMTEAYGLTQSVLFKDSAQRGINFIHQSQNPYLAWRHGVRDGGNDTMVTAWAVMALKSAQMAELEIDKGAYVGALAWLDKVTDPKTGRVGNHPARAPIPGLLGPGDPAPAWNAATETLTAAGVLARIFCHASGDPEAIRSDALIGKGADLLLQSLPRWDPDAGTIDFTYWTLGSLAMFQVGGERWERWNAALQKAVLERQRLEEGRDERGSWDAVDPWSRRGGRVFATAMNTLCMETYYRYGRVIGMK